MVLSLHTNGIWRIMIGFNALGYLGRLGNQMFQFAALKGIAANRGFTYCIPPSDSYTEDTNVEQYDAQVASGKAMHQLFLPFKLEKTSDLNCQYLDPKRPTAPEAGFNFDENLFNRVPDWVNIQGFFQSWKYFKHIEDEIRDDFQFKDFVQDPCNEMMSSLEEVPISLHIRRKDYVTNPNHSALGIEYYQKALKEFDENETVLVFSDDPDWCKEQELFADDRFMIAEGNSGWVDMCLMTMCKGHIIANSSFSWWGAWLAKSEKVVAPSGWFNGSDLEHLDTTDLIPDEWIQL